VRDALRSLRKKARLMIKIVYARQLPWLVSARTKRICSGKRVILIHE